MVIVVAYILKNKIVVIHPANDLKTKPAGIIPVRLRILNALSVQARNSINTKGSNQKTKLFMHYNKEFLRLTNVSVQRIITMQQYNCIVKIPEKYFMHPSTHLLLLTCKAIYLFLFQKDTFSGIIMV